MLGVRLEPELESRLEALAKKTGRTKSYYAREAIREFVEDREDYEIALAASRHVETVISLEELIRKYGLEDKLREEGGKAVRKVERRSTTQNRDVSATSRRRSA